MTDLRPLGQAYEDTRARISELAREGEAEAAEVTVPACPEWSVHDVVAHTAGNCTDILAGNVSGAATAEWTQRQVDERRDRSLSEVLAEWDEAGPQVAAMIDDFPGWYGYQLIADLTAHEHDIRGALDRPGARDSDSIAIANEVIASCLLHSAMRAQGIGPLEIAADDRRWVVGTGDPATGDRETWREAVATRDPLPDPAGPVQGSVKLSGFELFRSAMGRRSPDQIRAYDWSVDPEPFLPAFGYAPFEPRRTPLEE